MAVDYLKVAQASDLQGRDRFLYRALEILPAALSGGTLVALTLLSWLKPAGVAYFIIVFDVYWLLLVLFLILHLISAYRALTKNKTINWQAKCQAISGWQEVCHLVILPVYNESKDIITASLRALIDDGYPADKLTVVLAVEERAGEEQMHSCRRIESEFKDKFGYWLLTVHPDGIAGELKGKGANQAWAARAAQKEIIDKAGIDYAKILVSVFDVDTVVGGGYFWRLTHAFLTVPDPHRSSYQPIPVYHNNLWEAPWFARVSAYSNTFWQMMQQVREEKLATYSSHSMTWQALVDIDFWATNMVS